MKPCTRLGGPGATAAAKAIFERPVPASRITESASPRSNRFHERGGAAAFADRLAARREFYFFAARPEHETICVEGGG